MNSLTESDIVIGTGAVALKLGEMLLSEQKLSRSDLERALEVQRSLGGRLG